MKFQRQLRQHVHKYINGLCLLCMAAFVSCEYTATGINYQSRSIPDPFVSIDINGGSDTVYVWGYAELRYDLDLEDRTFYEGSLLLDGVAIHHFAMLQGSTLINTTDYPSGGHSLLIRVTASSGSGSLADIAGAEGFVFERQIVLIFDNDPPAPLSIHNIVRENGELTIYWEKFDRPHFKQYNIEVGNYDANGNIDSDPLVSIFDGSQNSVIDSSYIGSPLIYRVNLAAENGNTEGAWYFYNEEGSSFYPSIRNPGFSLEVNWSPCKYPQNFEEYEITRSGVEIFSSSTVNDTSFVDLDPLLGDTDGYLLRVTSKGSNEDRYHVLDTLIGAIGVDVPVSGNMQISDPLNSFYTMSGTSVLRYDASSHALLDSVYFQSEYNYFKFGISQDGSNAYVMTYFNDIGEIHRVDPTSLSITDSWTTSSLLGYNGRVGQILSVSNTNVIVFPSYRYWDNRNWAMGVVVINMDDPSQVLNPNYQYLTSAAISANGDYVFAYDSLYLYQNNSLDVIGGWEHYSTWSFIEEGNELVLSTNTGIELRNSSDLSIISIIATEEHFRDPTYDPTTGYLGGLHRLAGRYKIFDLATGETKFDFNYAEFFPGKLYKNRLYLRRIMLDLSEEGN